MRVSERSWLWIKSSCATCAFVFRIFSWPLLRPRGGRCDLLNFRAESWGRTIVLLRPCAVECPLCGDSFISEFYICAIEQPWCYFGLIWIIWIKKLCHCDNYYSRLSAFISLWSCLLLKVSVDCLFAKVAGPDLVCELGRFVYILPELFWSMISLV